MGELTVDIVRNKLLDLRQDIEELYAESRPRSLALTKLDECGLWLGFDYLAAPTKAQVDPGRVPVT